jgi:hypothetical protein
LESSRQVLEALGAQSLPIPGAALPKLGMTQKDLVAMIASTSPSAQLDSSSCEYGVLRSHNFYQQAILAA